MALHTAIVTDEQAAARVVGQAPLVIESVERIDPTLRHAVVGAEARRAKAARFHEPELTGRIESGAKEPKASVIEFA